MEGFRGLGFNIGMLVWIGQKSLDLAGKKKTNARAVCALNLCVARNFVVASRACRDVFRPTGRVEKKYAFKTRAPTQTFLPSHGGEAIVFVGRV